MVQHINQEIPDYSSYSVETECLNLKSFLDQNNLWIPESFYKKIKVGDVIDLYDLPPNMRQLYSNPQFKKLCSYSDEVMKSQPFPKLFWRSDDIQIRLIRKISEVAFSANEAVEWGIEKHELIENLHPNKRTFEIELGWIAPCFKKDTNDRVGLVSSLNVALIFEWG